MIALTYNTKRGVPREANGGVPVNPQDQTTQAVPNYFLKSLSNFSLISDTGVSTVDTIVRNFEASGILEDDEILLLDPDEDRSIYGVAYAVDGTTASLDRAIDHIYPMATTLGRKVTSQKVIDGSTTEQIFSIRSGTVPSDTIYLTIGILSATEPDFSKFGNQAPLTRGLTLRIVNGFQKTIYNFKTLGEMEEFGAEVKIQQKSGGGSWGTTAKFDLKKLLGVALRVHSEDVTQWVVQDVITQQSMKISASGHLTEGEM